MFWQATTKITLTKSSHLLHSPTTQHISALPTGNLLWLLRRRPAASHLSHRPSKRRVRGRGRMGPGGQEGDTRHGKGCRSLRGYSRGLCLSGLQTVTGSGQKRRRCPDEKAEVMEEGKGEKRYLSCHKQVCLFFRNGGGSCRTVAAQVRGHSQDLGLDGLQKTRYRRTAAQPPLRRPLPLKQENRFSQIRL